MRTGRFFTEVLQGGWAIIVDVNPPQSADQSAALVWRFMNRNFSRCESNFTRQRRSGRHHSREC
jgi:hypothetical protein